jgi:hypothetical protein
VFACDGHLMPGNEDEAATLLDAYLERANTRAHGVVYLVCRPQASYAPPSGPRAR